MRAALMIKATLRSSPGLDVRMSIGLGEADYQGKKVTENNGQAYVRSGECFEKLKKVTMIVCTGQKENDRLYNYMLELALLRMDDWPPATAAVVYAALRYPEMNQSQLAAKVRKSQSSVSEALSRAGFDKIVRLEDYFASFYL